MGDAVARLPGIETSFSHVLPAVAADADWNSVPDPAHPTLQNIKLEREKALVEVTLMKMCQAKVLSGGWAQILRVPCNMWLLMRE